MKIIQINKFFFLKGGSEKYFFDLSNLLAKNGHSVIAWSVRHKNNFRAANENDFAPDSDFSKKENLLKELKKPAKLFRLFWNWPAKRKLEKVIKRERPALAHLHNIFSQLSPSIIFSLKKHHIPVIMTLHDYKMFCPNYTFFSQGQACFDCLTNGHYRQAIKKKCVKSSYFKSIGGYLESKWHKDILKTAEQIDFFIAPSRFMEEQALKWGIPQEKISRVSNFIETDEGLDGEKLNSKEGPAYFLFFGRLSREKGIDFLIESFKTAASELGEIKLKIAGEGPEKEKIEKAIKGHRNIELIGVKKGRKLKDIISQSLAIIAPSLWPENFPYTVLESYALAKPVIASRVGGLEEMIDEEKTGLLFSLGDQKELAKKIIWAANNQKETAIMGKRGLKKAKEEYYSQKHYQKILSIYERVLGQ